MRRTLSVTDLDALPSGAQVNDSDGDTWTKDFYRCWGIAGYSGSYQGWSSGRLADEYTIYGTVPEVAEPTAPVRDDSDRALLAEHRLARVISLATFFKGMPVGDTALQLIIETAEGKN